MTRAAPGGIKRLSVAVLLRDPEKGRRTAMEVNQITDLVKSAVGYDAARQDKVTGISKKFADSSAAASGPKWYDNSWLPMLARNLTAIVIALLVLLLGVRPLLKTMLKKRADGEAGVKGALAGPDGAPMGSATGDGIGEDGIRVTDPVGIEDLEDARGYEQRVHAVRGFTRDNPARAALAVRDMMGAEAK